LRRALRRRGLQIATCNPSAFSAMLRALAMPSVAKRWHAVVVQEHRLKTLAKVAEAQQQLKAVGWKGIFTLAEATGDGPLESTGGTAVLLRSGYGLLEAPGGPLDEPGATAALVEAGGFNRGLRGS
jgi:hypothetical protein